MKLLVDAGVYGNGYQKGIQRYLHELLKRVPDDFGIIHHLDGRIILPDDLNPHLLKTFDRRLPGKNLPLRAWRTWARHRSTAGYDVYHTPYLGICPQRKIPSVMVVHDMVCEKLPQYFEANSAIETARKKKAIAAATLLIAISQATADDLLEVYPEVQGRIRVVHHGAEHLARIDVGEPADIPSFPYALFVGDRTGYKNFSTVLDAMLESDWPSDIVLKIAGPQPSAGELVDVQRKNLQHRVSFLGRTTDSDLAQLYNQASCFLFPSLHEGFGFPLIEAQTMGTPVVASLIPVFIEIGGNSFESFESLDPASLAKAVSCAVTAERSSTLRRLGFLNAARFSWQEAASKTIAVWRETANMSS